MKSNRKTKTIILIILGILFTFSPIFFNNPRFTARDRDVTSNHNYEFNHYNLKISAVSEKIHIINNSGWVDFRNAGNCTGSGNYTHPYVIEDLIIDGGDSGSCILIENSNVYFKIENCSVYNAGWGSDAGIRLLNVNNSQLLGNDCSSSYLGIDLSNGSYNNTIAGNIVNNNGGGIHLFETSYNTISGNTVNNNIWCGIYILGSNYTILSGNTVNDNNIHGIQLGGSYNNTISGNTVNKNTLCGIVLFGSYNNTISGNTANNNKYGIYFENGTNNIVLENNANSNEYNGIHFENGINNIVLGNTANDNLFGIFLDEVSNENVIYLNCFTNNGFNALDDGSNNNWDNGIKGNYWDDYIGSDADDDGIGDNPYIILGDAGSQDNFPLMRCPISAQDGGIPIELIILISVISGGALIGVVTLLLIIHKRNRLE
ncbi:MAG: right-handed parallel beta-helix repeat-containing protein [Promethearchaeota archaeon]